MLPASPEVVLLARRRAALAVAVGLDPLPADAPWDAVTEYVRQGVALDRVWFGSAGLLSEEA
ncbi:hypothetical protein [Streptomyces sp. NPDC046805]|uniref:hypothetical protein n=1 Tax=Streptomyces sp. NPDC046805 TaxID=3155134 RepID=UPI0033C49951